MTRANRRFHDKVERRNKKTKIGAKMLIAAILSLSIGVAFASPLLYSHTVRPFPFAPKGPTADVRLDIVYADFQIQPVDVDTELPQWFPANETAYTLTYNIVLNVTNNCDKAAVIDLLYFCAAKNATNGNMLLSTGGSGGMAKGAWVDGIWYNVTWINGTTLWPQFDESGKLSSQSSFSSTGDFEPYLQEGVILFDKYVNSDIVATYMDMNGTWVNVTGRINVSRPERNEMTVMLDPIAAETRFFIESDDSSTEEIGYSADTRTPVGLGKFDNTWAPYETRLIMLNGTRLADSSTLETLKTGRLFLRTQAISRLANSYINGTLMDTSSMADSITQVQLQIVGDKYSYNTILSENQMFQPDQYGVEVMVKPRS